MDEFTQEAETPNKLTTYKLEAVLERLHQGYSLITREQLMEKLVSGEFELHRLDGQCHALLTWRDNGDTMEVLTCEGSVEGAWAALGTIESIARKFGAKRIIGLARYGWKPLLIDAGFQTSTKLTFFQKELLNADSLS